MGPTLHNLEGFDLKRGNDREGVTVKPSEVCIAPVNSWIAIVVPCLV